LLQVLSTRKQHEGFTVRVKCHADWSKANSYSKTNQGGKKKKSVCRSSYSLNGQRRQQRAERQRENEKGDVKEETEGETGTRAKSTSRLVKALLHTAAILTPHTHTHTHTHRHTHTLLLSTELIRKEPESITNL